MTSNPNSQMPGNDPNAGKGTATWQLAHLNLCLLQQSSYHSLYLKSKHRPEIDNFGSELYFPILFHSSSAAQLFHLILSFCQKEKLTVKLSPFI